MGVKLIDLSMKLQRDDDLSNVAKPVLVEMETHREMAVSIGTDQYGMMRSLTTA